MRIGSLSDLFEHELKDIYSAEKQILDALPKMAKRAQAEELRDAFNEHLEATRQQVERLDRIFESLEVEANGQKCKGMAGLLAEANELLAQDLDESVVDAALIGAAQRVEHYEIAAYGTARAYARLLEDEESASLLEESLDEEIDADQKLSELAESTINLEAAEAESEDDDDEEEEEEVEEEAPLPAPKVKRSARR